MPASRLPHTTPTLAGCVALVLWSTTFGLTRVLTEALGTFTAIAFTHGIAGLLGMAVLLARRGTLRRTLRLPSPYLFGCGGLFVLYMISVNVAVGFSTTREQAVEVSIINYLWPSFTVLFSVIVLRRRAKLWLGAGILLALLGIFVMLQSGSGVSLSGFAERFAANGLPYVLAFIAAASWGLYSVLSHKLGGEGGAVPFFLLVSAAIMACVRMLVSETTQWSPAVVGPLIYMAVLPGWLAYSLWDVAMRRGRIVLVAVLSYLTPILSAVISCVVLRVRPGWALAAACALVVVGAVISKASVQDVPDPDVG